MVKKQSTISFRYDKHRINFIEPDPIDYISEKIKTDKNFYENELLAWLKAQKLPEGDFVDIGANIGNHTIYFSKVLNRKTWAFEPYGKAFDLLKANIELNNLTNVETFNFGLGTENCKVDMELPDNNNIGAAKVKVNKQGSSLLKRGDDALEKIKKITLMKIDVEGYEQNVLNGCLNAIKKHKPVLLVECMNKSEYAKNFDILKKIGYAPVAIFGATPMVVFSAYQLAKVDTAGQLLDKYFEIDAKFNIVRNKYIDLQGSHYRLSTNNQSLRDELQIFEKQLREKLKRKEAELSRLNTSYKSLKISYKKIIKSRSYRLGRILLAPLRNVKRVMRRFGR